MTSQLTSRPLRRARTAGIAAVVGLFTLGVAACGDDSTSDTADTAAPSVVETTVAETDVAETTVPESVAPAGEITVTGQWARTSPADAANGAAYLTVTSSADDKLVGAMVPMSVAGMTQIHETVMATPDTTMGTGMATDSTMMPGTGEMTMRPVDFIELTAGTPVELKPGGYHIMLMDLVNPLKVGDTIQLTLTFEQAGEVVVDVPVLDEAP